MFLFLFPAYCSCPPFECICSFPSMAATNMHYGSTSPQNGFHQPQMLDSYWMQEPGHAQTYPTELATSTVNPQYDFASLSTDLFQPDEIFQLDQPIKPDLVTHNHSDTARSPPTLLDLGSGTIHREFKNEDYWNQSISNLMNDDSNNSSNSRFNLNSSPDNTQVSLNNNVLTALSQNEVMHYPNEGKFNNQSHHHYFPQVVHQESDYKGQNNFADIIGDSKMFFSDDSMMGTFEGNFQNIKLPYKSNSCDEKYVDVPQYVDYTNVLGAYESKMCSNERLMSDLDFRINSCLSSSNSLSYGVENFDMLHQ